MEEAQLVNAVEEELSTNKQMGVNFDTCVHTDFALLWTGCYATFASDFWLVVAMPRFIQQQFYDRLANVAHCHVSRNVLRVRRFTDSLHGLCHLRLG
eukprot:1876493-Amphidinium_carterae.1